MSTPTYYPSTEYHLFNHPTTKGLYMFMLCYCNGALAREGVRDEINKSKGVTDKSWAEFGKAVDSTQVAGRSSSSDPAKIGVYFPLPENIPSANKGTWRYNYSATDGTIKETQEGWNLPHDDVRAIIESQALSMRMRSEALLSPDAHNGHKAQPRRLYFVGGGSRNAAIMSITAEVLGGFEGAYKLDIGSNACALGASYYAAWALERKGSEAFEDYVDRYWEEETHAVRIGDAYKEGVWEEYGSVMKGFRIVEEEIMKTNSHA